VEKSFLSFKILFGIKHKKDNTISIYNKHKHIDSYLGLGLH